METGKHSDMQHLLIEVDKSMIWAVILKWLGNNIRVKTIKGDIWSSQGGIINPEEGIMGQKTLPCHLWGVCITQVTTSKLIFLNSKVLPMTVPHFLLSLDQELPTKLTDQIAKGAWLLLWEWDIFVFMPFSFIFI